MKGLSGILRPNGVFVSCSYANHGQAASEIPETEEEQCVYMSSGMETKNNDNASIIYFIDNMTFAQKKWLLFHIYEMDKTQKKQFKEWLFKKK